MKIENYGVFICKNPIISNSKKRIFPNEIWKYGVLENLSKWNLEIMGFLFAKTCALWGFCKWDFGIMGFWDYGVFANGDFGLWGFCKWKFRIWGFCKWKFRIMGFLQMKISDMGFLQMKISDYGVFPNDFGFLENYGVFPNENPIIFDFHLEKFRFF